MIVHQSNPAMLIVYLGIALFIEICGAVAIAVLTFGIVASSMNR